MKSASDGSRTRSSASAGGAASLNKLPNARCSKSLKPCSATRRVAFMVG